MPNKKRVRLNLEAKVIKFNPNANIKDFNKEPIESISLAEESEAQRPQLHDPKAYTKRGVSVAAPINLEQSSFWGLLLYRQSVRSSKKKSADALDAIKLHLRKKPFLANSALKKSIEFSLTPPGSKSTSSYEIKRPTDLAICSLDYKLLDLLVKHRSQFIRHNITKKLTDGRQSASKHENIGEVLLTLVKMGKASLEEVKEFISKWPSYDRWELKAMFKELPNELKIKASEIAADEADEIKASEITADPKAHEITADPKADMRVDQAKAANEIKAAEISRAYYSISEWASDNGLLIKDDVSDDLKPRKIKAHPTATHRHKEAAMTGGAAATKLITAEQTPKIPTAPTTSLLGKKPAAATGKIHQKQGGALKLNTYTEGVAAEHEALKVEQSTTTFQKSKAARSTTEKALSRGPITADTRKGGAADDDAYISKTKPPQYLDLLKVLEKVEEECKNNTLSPEELQALQTELDDTWKILSEAPFEPSASQVHTGTVVVEVERDTEPDDWVVVGADATKASYAS